MQERDYLWFKNNCVRLFQEYGAAYLAIKNQQVLGTYPSYAAGVKETVKTEPIGTFIVQQCGADESAYTNYIASLI